MGATAQRKIKQTKAHIPQTTLHPCLSSEPLGKRSTIRKIGDLNFTSFSLDFSNTSCGWKGSREMSGEKQNLNRQVGEFQIRPRKRKLLKYFCIYEKETDKIFL